MSRRNYGQPLQLHRKSAVDEARFWQGRAEGWTRRRAPVRETHHSRAIRGVRKDGTKIERGAPRPRNAPKGERA